MFGKCHYLILGIGIIIRLLGIGIFIRHNCAIITYFCRLLNCIWVLLTMMMGDFPLIYASLISPIPMRQLIIGARLTHWRFGPLVLATTLVAGLIFHGCG